jgi:hypothetical protein
MPELTKAQIAKSSTAIERVETPGWGAGGFVYCRQFPASMAEEVREVVDKVVNDKKLTEAERMAYWTVLGTCDRRGRRKFTQKDIPMLIEKSLIPLQECYNAIMRLNSLEVTGTEKNESGQPGE